MNNRIRKVTFSTGIMTTIAGTGEQGINGDGNQAISARIGEVYGLALDSSYLYLAIPSANKVRRISFSTGIITSFAGSGVSGSSGDGNQGIVLSSSYMRVRN